MRRHNFLLLFASLFLFTFQANSAVQKNSEQEKLYEELTGKKTAPAEVAQKKAAPTVDGRPASRKLLDAGFYAFTKKDYISALKYYNTIIVRYPSSSEYQLAYLAKSKMYNEMGLIDQAKLNLQIANEIGKKTQITK